MPSPFSPARASRRSLSVALLLCGLASKLLFVGCSEEIDDDDKIGTGGPSTGGRRATGGTGGDSSATGGSGGIGTGGFPAECVDAGLPCDGDAVCCGGLCDLDGLCGMPGGGICRNALEGCNSDTDCCTFFCVDGFCVNPTCQPNGAACDDAFDCCVGICDLGATNTCTGGAAL